MRRMIAMLAAGAVLVSTSAVSLAQNPQPAPPAQEPTVIVQGRVGQGPDGLPPLPPASTFVFVASEFGFGGKIVQGKPYSAEAVTETVQTLGDGNRIVNRSTSSVYRDSEGRTRREQTLNAIGGFANASEPIQTIFINDPVAGVSYTLDNRTHVAHKTMQLKIERRFGPVGVAPNVALPKFEIKLAPKPGEPVAVMPPPGAGAPMPGGEHFSIRTEAGGVGYIMTRRKTGEDKNAVHESLGRQMIEGVEADGTRVTITIPAGEIGNERPIQIVSEQWYSAELGVSIMSRHSDPRSGETTYRLTNIDRTEPAKSLFEVPAGYTISEGLPGMMKQATPGPRVRKQVTPE
jgi:hypothetical protein